MLDYVKKKQEADEKKADLAAAAPLAEVTGVPSAATLAPLAEFFGKGKTEDEFYDDLESSIKEVIRLRKYDRAITFDKGQILIKELLLSGLPELPDTFDERMELIHELYLKTGHVEWAESMEKILPQLDHSSEILAGVPGRA